MSDDTDQSDSIDLDDEVVDQLVNAFCAIITASRAGPIEVHIALATTLGFEVAEFDCDVRRAARSLRELRRVALDAARDVLRREQGKAQQAEPEPEPNPITADTTIH